MASSTLVLPGDFEAAKNYLLAGSTLMAWRDALVNDRALPGAGLQETSLPGIGRVLQVVPAYSSSSYSTASRSGISPFHGYLSEAGVMRIGSGRLVTNPKTGALQAIDGLDTDIPLTSTLKVALIVSMDDSSLLGSNITGAEISFPSSWGDAYTYAGTAPDTYQSLAEIKIGEVFPYELPAGTPGFEFALGDSLFHFEQYLNTHLCMMLATLDGQAGQLPMAWAG